MLRTIGPVPLAHRESPAHHSRTAATWLLVAALVAVGACGTVDVAPTAKDDAGGNSASSGGGAAGGAGGAAGEMGGAGAAGHAGATGTAGTTGSAGEGGRGGTSGQGGGTSSGPDPSKAAVCKYAAMGGDHFQDCHTSDGGNVEVTINGGVPGSGVNSWRCRTGCASPTGMPEPVVPCAGSNATYCVASCSDCY